MYPSIFSQGLCPFYEVIITAICCMQHFPLREAPPRRDLKALNASRLRDWLCVLPSCGFDEVNLPCFPRRQLLSRSVVTIDRKHVSQSGTRDAIFQSPPFQRRAVAGSVARTSWQRRRRAPLLAHILGPSYWPVQPGATGSRCQSDTPSTRTKSRDGVSESLIIRCDLIWYLLQAHHRSQKH